MHPFFAEPFAAFAHRGGWIDPADTGRENTLYAFDQAVQLGYRYVETDVHATSDGVLIAFHDLAADRVTGSSGLIKDMTYTQLRELRINGTDQVPTLDEVLAAFPETLINIDLKAPEAVTPLAQTLARHNAWRRVCVTSFSSRSLDAFRRLTNDRTATGISQLGVAWNAYVPWLPRLVNAPGQVLQIPLTTMLAGRQVPVLTARLLANARAAGKRVHVWTINEAEQMHAVLDAGVDGIISDRIDVLKRVLVERGYW